MDADPQPCRYWIVQIRGYSTVKKKIYKKIYKAFIVFTKYLQVPYEEQKIICNGKPLNVDSRKTIKQVKEH